MLSENVEKFITAVAESLERETFVKLTLGNYRGADAQLRKILIRPVKIKSGTKLFFLYRSDTRDEAKNYNFAEGAKIIESLLGNDFRAGHLFTTENDFQLEIGKKNARLHVGKPTLKANPNIAHNREKQLLISPNAFYLQALGIADERGNIKDKQQDKWRQINKFVEIVGNLFDNSQLKDAPEISVVDMGSGKGYLTFAIYDYFTNARKIRANVVGVEARDELIALCNNVAGSCGFDNLKFEKGLIADFQLKNADVLIALHACDTATDDALFKGIKHNSSLIICAPCCHKEIRRQIKPPAMLKNVLKHGSLLEREAETLTDGLRALLLEKENYQTKVFEFIDSEHTPKNNMIVGTKREQMVDAQDFERQISEIKDFYGIREQRLEKLLSS